MASNYPIQLSGCTFQWKVKFSFSWLYTQPIESPTFVIDALQSTTWKLWLYPKGLNRTSYIGCSLNRDDNCNGPDTIEINFELAFLSADGIPLVSENVLGKKFSKGSSSGFDLGTSGKIILEKRAEYMPLDILVVQCKIWSNTENDTILMILGNTTERVERCYFVWKIDAFSCLKSGQEIDFVIKSISGKKLITLVLSVVLGQSDEEAFEVHCADFDKDIKSCNIKSQVLSGERNFKCESEIHILDHFVTSKIILPFSKDALIDMKPEYFPDDTLLIRFQCAFSYGILIKSIESIDCGSTSTVTVSSIEKDAIEQDWDNNLAATSNSLRKDMNFLMRSELHSDVAIRAKTRKFSVHKSILSARSPVFTSIFRENRDQISEVDISNFEDATVLAMLLYVYTDAIRERHFEKVLHLYEIAFAYEIKSLEKKCIAILKSRFRSSNVCETLLFAEGLRDEILKTAVIQHITQNEAEVYREKEWKNLVTSRPLLALEVLNYKWKN